MNINVKFYMYFNGERIRTIEDLRENFFAEDILEAYSSGQLAKWLKVWRHKKELAQVEAVKSENAREILAELMRIFDSDAEPEEINASLSVYDYLEERRKFREHAMKYDRGELDTLRRERDKLSKELDTVKRVRDTFRKERDALRKERDTLQQELDNLRKERDTLGSERDTLKHNRDTLQGERDTLKQERDRLTRERDFFKQERDRLTRELDAARSERIIKRPERDTVSTLIESDKKEKRLTIPASSIRTDNWLTLVPSHTACRITNVGNSRGKLFVFMRQGGSMIPIETACMRSTYLEGISVFCLLEKSTEDLYFDYEEVYPV